MTTPTEAEVREAVTDEQLDAIWRAYEFTNEYGITRMARDMETLKRRIEQDAVLLQSAQADTARLEWLETHYWSRYRPGGFEVGFSSTTQEGVRVAIDAARKVADGLA